MDSYESAARNAVNEFFGIKREEASAQDDPGTPSDAGVLRAFVSNTGNPARKWAAEQAKAGFIDPDAISTWATSYAKNPRLTEGLLPVRPTYPPLESLPTEELSAEGVASVKKAIADFNRA